MEGRSKNIYNVSKIQVKIHEKFIYSIRERRFEQNWRINVMLVVLGKKKTMVTKSLFLKKDSVKKLSGKVISYTRC